MKKNQRQRRRSCDPGPGHTLLTIGQDFFSIQEYVSSQYNASLHRGSTAPSKIFYPAATMVYTDIQTLRGVSHPVDYGSGIEYAKGLVEAFPASGLQMGLWLNGTAGCRDIVHGKLDDKIHELFANIAEWNLPKVFLRVGYEFDNPYFGYSQDPSVYVQAFRYIVNACQNQLAKKNCRDLVAFCWHSWAAPRWIEDLETFYPGDVYVDWIGISIFQQLYPWATSNTSQGDFAGGNVAYVKQVLDFAHQQDKPVLIAESTPFGGMLWNGTEFGDGRILPTSSVEELPKDIWELWFAPTLKLIDDHDIRMWSYINCDWNSQPMWHNIGFGDTRLVSSAQVMDQWWEHVLQNPRFVMGSLECGGDEQDKVHQYSTTQRSATLVVDSTTLFGDWSTNELMGVFLSKLLVLPFVAGMAVLLRYRYHGRWSTFRRTATTSSSRSESDKNNAQTIPEQQQHGDYGSTLGA